MAVSSTGRVVGVALNGCHGPGHLDEMQRNADDCPNPRFRKILQLLAAVERGSDVFSKFPDVDRLVEVRILSVDTALRGRGIAKALLEESRSVKDKVHLEAVPPCKLSPPAPLSSLIFLPRLSAFYLCVLALLHLPVFHSVFLPFRPVFPSVV
jgi:predicted GNAT family acetyltransferase